MSLHTFANVLAHSARELRVVPAQPVALTYPDYVAMGREWAREQITAAAMSRGRLPAFTASQIEAHAVKFADVNCPLAVRKAHFAALQAARDAEYGASGFVVGQYGLRKAGSL